MSTRPYFAAMSRFESEVSQKQYERALKELQKGLTLTPAALKEMHFPGAGDPNVPFLEDVGGAIAALFDDHKSFLLMEKVAALPFRTRKPDIARFKRDAEIMRDIRNDLADGLPRPLSELKQRLSAEDGARLRKILDWMQKNGELWVDKSPRDHLVTFGRPQPRRISVSTFRRGQSAISPELLERSRFPKAVPSKRTSKPLMVLGGTSLREEKAPPAKRLAGPADTWICEMGTWLVGASREQPDGTDACVVARRDHNGSVLGDVLLHGKPWRVKFSGERPYFVVMDKNLLVQVPDFNGRVVLQFSLAKTPEVLARARQYPGLRLDALVSDVDVDLARAEVVFAVLGQYFWFQLDGSEVGAGSLFDIPITLDVDSDREYLGQGISSVGLPGDIHQVDHGAWVDLDDWGDDDEFDAHVAYLENLELDGFPEDVVMDDRLYNPTDEYFTNSEDGIDRDSFAFVQLVGGRLFVCTKAGLLLELDRAGTVAASWHLSNVPDRIWEWNRRLFLDDLGELLKGKALAHPTRTADAAKTGPLIFARNGNCAAMTNAVTGDSRVFQAKRAVYGVWPTSSGIEVMTTTTRARVYMPDRI